jgi:hypothetical protein
MQELRASISRVIEISQQPDIAPHTLADLLVKLTALYASVAEVLMNREFTFNNVLASHHLAEGAASRASIKAKTTQEYKDWKEAQMVEKVLVEHIRALKKSLSVRESERWMTR